MKAFCLSFAVVVSTIMSLPLSAQVPLPQPINIPSTSYGGGSVLTGAFTNANGPPGTGYTLRNYGNSGSGGVVIFSAPTANPATLTISTRKNAMNAPSAPNGAPDVFSSSTSYATPSTSFNIFSPRNSTASILIPTTSGGSTFFDLSGPAPADLVQANMRLNQALSFNQGNFFDDSGAAVTPAVGNFFFTLEFNATSNAYSNINLNYTPVPEPVGLLALAVGGLAGLRRLRRFVVA